MPWPRPSTSARSSLGRTMSTAVVLFTRDLRVHDQPALAEAARTSEHVVPLFVLDDAILRRARRAEPLVVPARRARRPATLAARARRRPRRPARRSRRGDAAARAAAGAADGLRRRRRERVRARARASGSRASARPTRIDAARSSTRRRSFRPGRWRRPARDHYRVFTPYWRRWRGAAAARASRRAPARCALPPGLDAGDLPALARVDGAHAVAGSAARRRASRAAPARALARDGARGLRAARDELAADATSRLSPYLHFGCVSPLEVATAAARRSAGGDAFVRQLCWRDFFQQLLAAYPSLPRATIATAATTTGATTTRRFARWREGRTGVPDRRRRHAPARARGLACTTARA